MTQKPGTSSLNNVMKKIVGLIAVLAATTGCNNLIPTEPPATDTLHPTQEHQIPTVRPAFYNQKKPDGTFILSCRQLAIAKATIHSKNALNPQAERVVESHLNAIRSVLSMRCSNRSKPHNLSYETMLFL